MKLKIYEKEAYINSADGSSLDESSWTTLAEQLTIDAIKVLICEYSFTLSKSDEIFKAIQKNRSLRCVVLKSSKIGESLASVINALSENKNLNHLQLCAYKEGANAIDDAFMYSLSSIITNNSGLQKLNLEHISIKNANFSIFCQALAKTPYLKELNLVSVSLSSENRKLLTAALKSNPGIKVCKLNCDEALEIALGGRNPYSFYTSPSPSNDAEETKKCILM